MGRLKKGATRKTRPGMELRRTETLRDLAPSVRNSFNSLTREVEIAQGALEWLQKRFKKDPGGGIIISPGQIRPFVDLIVEHTSRLGRLKRHRLELAELVEGRKEGKSLAKWARAWKPTNGG